jgi:putative membrane protein
MSKKVLIGAFALVFAGLPAFAQSHSDKEFLEKSSQGNVAEVELAKLALEKSHNAQVRGFAQRMIHDHEMLARQMKPFVMQAGVQPSTSLDTEHQHLYNELKNLSGPEFDKQYVEAMDKDHHQDLKEFQDEVSSTQDMKLKQAVASGEKVIAEHTRMIDEISRKMGMNPTGA